MFPWLQYSATLKGVLCFYCAKVFLKKTMLASKFDPAFVSTGFKNWKKTVEKFTAHAKSHSHCHATIVYAQETNIASQLSSVVSRQQEEARNPLLKIVGCVQYLARQGIALRGHDEERGNFSQLLKCKTTDDPALRK